MTIIRVENGLTKARLLSCLGISKKLIGRSIGTVRVGGMSEIEELRGSANRRVAYVSRNNGKAVESLLELPSMKSCRPNGGSS